MKTIYQPSEHDIQTSILQYLKAYGWLAFRMNAGMLSVGYGKNRRAVWMHPAGTPDIIAFKLNRPPIAIEVKRKGNKTSLAQNRMLEKFRNHGVATLVAYSVEEVDRWLKTVPA